MRDWEKVSNNRKGENESDIKFGRTNTHLSRLYLDWGGGKNVVISFWYIFVTLSLSNINYLLIEILTIKQIVFFTFNSVSLCYLESRRMYCYEIGYRYVLHKCMFMYIWCIMYGYVCTYVFLKLFTFWSNMFRWPCKKNVCLKKKITYFNQ